MTTFAQPGLVAGLLAGLLAAPLAAQIGRGEVGLLAVDGNAAYGSVCTYQFQCQHLPAVLTRGNTAELQIRGVRNRPYAVAFGFDLPHACIALAGIHNALMAPPLFVLAVGSLTEQDTIRACPGGVGRMRFTVAAGLPTGAVFTIQALTWSYLAPNEVPTFTASLRTVLR